ncbi:MAG: methyltransferase domain-containing protein [Acidobacteriia bacterium]|nr:methyltransferase domain-containing protein [Terriglobia bacterium]
MPDWNPELYLKFADQRARPAADLIAQIKIANPKRIIDLGCGPGNSTAQLNKRWPQAHLTGLDSSAEMLAQARQKHPGWTWIESGIESWVAIAPYDLVFSNSALHWVADHGQLLRRLLSYVAPGGALAVQMPNNFHSPVHTAMKEVAESPRWSGILGQEEEHYAVETPAFYYNALRESASLLNIWETEYLQIMDGPRAVLDWIRSTGMRFYLERLPGEAERLQFEADCLRKIENEYVANDQGKVLFPYKRIFILAYR